MQPSMVAFVWFKIILCLKPGLRYMPGPREVIGPDPGRRSASPIATIETHPLFESDVRPSKSNDKPFM
ncbi:MAG: hypothetical protein C0511_13415 [Hyphomicrobium sp.]|nr:hypothetical protein [Hyphomicrobium sp.]PPC80608.1 MAG: hypothetical protein CTY40_08890 [Hyphomicrobium sp.]